MEHNVPTRWATINGQRVPIYETSPVEIHRRDMISFVVIGFVVFSVLVGLARCLLTIQPLEAALAAIAFLAMTEANLIYLKHRMGRWNSRSQEIAGFGLAAFLFVAAALNLSSFLIEMLQIRDFLTLERFWFVIIQPIVSSLAMLGSLYISIAMDPFRKVETIQRDAQTQKRLMEVESDLAMQIAAFERRKFAVANAPKFRQRKQQKVDEMLDDGTLDREISWAAAQAARDIFEQSELSALRHGSAVVISTGDGVAEPTVKPTSEPEPNHEPEPTVNPEPNHEPEPTVNPEPNPKPNFLAYADETGLFVSKDDKTVRIVGSKQGEHRDSRAKLSDEQRRELVRLVLENGLSNAEAGARFGVSGQYTGRLVAKHSEVNHEST